MWLKNFKAGKTSPAFGFFKFYKKQQQIRVAEQTKGAHKGKKESEREKKRGRIRQFYKTNKMKNYTSKPENKQNNSMVIN